MSEFAGKVVLITGAGRGIGRAAAQAFAAQGAKVAANDITPINLDVTVSLIRSAGGLVKDYIYDISKRLPARALVDEVLDDFGRLDILINNAAVKPHASVLEMDEWDWQRTLDVNLSGPFYLIQQAGRVMSDQGGGIMVNLAAGPQNLEAEAGIAAYLASKQGVIGLTRQAARELSPFNIRVNALCPGRELSGNPWERSQEAPEGEGSTVGEAASAILLLCSRASAHLNGQIVSAGEQPWQE